MKKLALIFFFLACFQANASTADYFCLQNTLYHEARGENANGMRSVAEVILNRVYSKEFPNSICEVTNQRGQFTYDKNKKDSYNKKVTIISLEYFDLYMKYLNNGRKLNSDLTKGSLFYYNPETSSRNGKKFFNTLNCEIKYGKHQFCN